MWVDPIVSRSRPRGGPRGQPHPAHRVGSGISNRQRPRTNSHRKLTSTQARIAGWLPTRTPRHSQYQHHVSYSWLTGLVGGGSESAIGTTTGDLRTPRPKTRPRPTHLTLRALHRWQARPLARGGAGTAAGFITELIGEQSVGGSRVVGEVVGRSDGEGSGRAWRGGGGARAAVTPWFLNCGRPPEPRGNSPAPGQKGRGHRKNIQPPSARPGSAWLPPHSFEAIVTSTRLPPLSPQPLPAVQARAHLAAAPLPPPPSPRQKRRQAPALRTERGRVLGARCGWRCAGRWTSYPLESCMPCSLLSPVQLLSCELRRTTFLEDSQAGQAVPGADDPRPFPAAPPPGPPSSNSQPCPVCGWAGGPSQPGPVSSFKPPQLSPTLSTGPRHTSLVDNTRSSCARAATRIEGISCTATPPLRRRRRPGSTPEPGRAGGRGAALGAQPRRAGAAGLTGSSVTAARGEERRRAGHALAACAGLRLGLPKCERDRVARQLPERKWRPWEQARMFCQTCGVWVEVEVEVRRVGEGGGDEREGAQRRRHMSLPGRREIRQGRANNNVDCVGHRCMLLIRSAVGQSSLCRSLTRRLYKFALRSTSGLRERRSELQRPLKSMLPTDPSRYMFRHIPSSSNVHPQLLVALGNRILARSPRAKRAYSSLASPTATRSAPGSVGRVPALQTTRIFTALPLPD